MNQVESSSKSVWVDLLCWSSAWTIIKCSRSNSLKKIHYVNVARSFVNFIPWLERRVKTQCMCVDNIIEPETKHQGISLYEIIQRRITDILNLWIQQKDIRTFIDNFCAKHRYNCGRFEAHLKEAAYPYVFRPIEISVLGEYCSGGSECIYIFRRTPFKRLFKLSLDFSNVYFYRTWFSHRLKIASRKDYYYDGQLNALYYKDRFSIIGHFMFIWLFNSFTALLNLRQVEAANSLEPAIGVELSQSRQRVDAINDLSWLESSGIPAQNIRAFEFVNYDEESIEFIMSFRIQRFKVLQFPSQLMKRLKMLNRDPHLSSLAAHPSFGLETVGSILKLMLSFFLWNQSSWLRFQSIKYLIRTRFWQSIYGLLNVKVLWTMFDVDEDKLTKGQAIEVLGGITAGGHWSNFPMYRIDNEKCLDVIMAWGEHFIKNNFQYSPFMSIFIVGYPCDYYFKMHRESARAIRQRHKEKFIISYHDNIMANDLPYSQGMQTDIHRMLLSLLRKFDQVVVLLKPKRRFLIDKMFILLPELAYFLREGRLEIFLGDTPRTKAVPAEIGMASDLVIGLGISTTAAEAYFAGAVAFHADFTGFENNEFGNRGRGSVVFRDIFTLEKAVIDRIEGRVKFSHEDYRGYYTCLDPFQDGCASKRIGFIMKRIREYLAQGLDRYVLLEKVKADYDVYLSSMKSFKKLSLN